MTSEINTAPSKSSSLRISTLFFIILIIIAILTWQWADRGGHIIDLRRFMAEYVANVDFFGKKPRQLIAEVHTNQQETKKRIKKLSVDAVTSGEQEQIVETLSNLLERIDTLPLAMDAHLTKVDLPLQQLAVASDNRWYKLINDICQDLQQVIIIQKIDDPEIELLSPSQRELLREKIKLQLLLAQYFLLSQDRTNYQESLETAINWISRHYDKQADSVIDLLNQLDQLHHYTFNTALPKVSKRHDTVHNYQLKRDEESE